MTALRSVTTTSCRAQTSLVGVLLEADHDLDLDDFSDEAPDDDDPLSASVQLRAAASFYLAPSLVKLYVEEINERWPKRDRASDGWIGDPSHSARVSDHNPDWSAGGVVRAVDIDVDGINVRELLNEVVGDPRVWYVIHDRKIYSRTYGWTAREYTGSNPHTAHVHISILHTRTAEEDESPWLGDAKRRRTRGMHRVDLSNVSEAFRSGGTTELPGVQRIQRALNARYDAGLRVDGFAGGSTRDAYRRHERSIGSPQPNGVPGRFSLMNLGRGRFRVVA
jgi:hypothetical protein